jgi:hypothetical protein
VTQASSQPGHVRAGEAFAETFDAGDASARAGLDRARRCLQLVDSMLIAAAAGPCAADLVATIHNLGETLTAWASQQSAPRHRRRRRPNDGGGLARALAVLVVHPTWTASEIAAAARVNRSTLYKYPPFVAARAELREAGREHQATRAVGRPDRRGQR